MEERTHYQLMILAVFYRLGMLVDVRVTILLVNDKSLQWTIETREDHDSILYKTAYRDVNRCKHFERLLLRCCHLIGRRVRDALFCG